MKKMAIIITLILCTFIIGGCSNVNQNNQSEYDKLKLALENDEFYTNYDNTNTYYSIQEGNYEYVKNINLDKNVSYNSFNLNNYTYEDYMYKLNDYLSHYKYDIINDRSELTFKNYKTNVVYKITYYNLDGKYNCFKNDNNTISNDCSSEFEIYLILVKDLKNKVMKILKNYDINYNKLINEF